MNIKVTAFTVSKKSSNTNLSSTAVRVLIISGWFRSGEQLWNAEVFLTQSRVHRYSVRRPQILRHPLTVFGYDVGVPRSQVRTRHIQHSRHTQFYAPTLASKNFLWLSLGRNQYRREGLWFVCLLYDGSTRRLTESGFMWFLWFYGEAGNRTCDPWFTRHSTYPLHHGGFSLWLQKRNSDCIMSLYYAYLR